MCVCVCVCLGLEASGDVGTFVAMGYCSILLSPCPLRSILSVHHITELAFETFVRLVVVKFPMLQGSKMAGGLLYTHQP